MLVFLTLLFNTSWLLSIFFLGGTSAVSPGTLTTLYLLFIYQTYLLCRLDISSCCWLWKTIWCSKRRSYQCWSSPSSGVFGPTQPIVCFGRALHESVQSEWCNVWELSKSCRARSTNCKSSCHKANHSFSEASWCTYTLPKHLLMVNISMLRLRLQCGKHFLLRNFSISSTLIGQAHISLEPWHIPYLRLA